MKTKELKSKARIMHTPENWGDRGGYGEHWSVAFWIDSKKLLTKCFSTEAEAIEYKKMILEYSQETLDALKRHA